jgi:uncharacterized cupin superfamily protein
MPVLIHLSDQSVRGDLNPAGVRPGADTGDPQLATLVIDPGSDAQTGIWECQPGGWPVANRPNTEVCYILSGRARLTDDDTGQITEITTGSFVVLPPGWSGRWDVIEPVRKAYTIF